MLRCIPFRFCLAGLALSLLFAGGCGQNEGGRCQINSDCASGLHCSDNSGNGVCRPSGTGPTGGGDAATANDAPEDLVSVAGPEAGPVEVEPVEVEPVAPSVDAESVESGAVD
jgi:hypothetical protein